MTKKLSLEELNRVSLETYHKKPKIPLVVVLDNIRSAHNVGSIFRTSDAYCVEQIIICGFSAQPPHKDIRKTALGATESVKWIYAQSAKEVVLKLKEEGYAIVSMEQTDSSVELNDWRIDGPVAVILGNEVAGVQDELIEISDVCVELEQHGTKHSLNVSVCAGITIWKAFQQLKPTL
jgi:23S rRNA (guanosine2251-2'-O)-methyltransferase